MYSFFSLLSSTFLPSRRRRIFHRSARPGSAQLDGKARFVDTGLSIPFMLYSTPCEYAIRALAYLARLPRRSSAPGLEIAREEGLPAPVLGKILQELVRKGLLESRRGPGGGFRMARRAELITLRDVVAAIDGLDHFLECAVGLERCSDDAPCPLHDTFKPLRTQVLHYLETTTVAQMARAVQRKKELLRRRTRRQA